MPCRAAARASAARSSGLAPTSRTRGGHGDAVGESVGSAGGGQGDQGPQERGEVLAGVVAARVDEIALGQAEALALAGPRQRPPGTVVAEPPGANAGRGASGTTRRRSRRMRRTRRAACADARLADDDRRRLAQELRPQALAEPGRRRSLRRPPAAPTGRDRAASPRSAGRTRSAAGPAPAAW